MCLAVPVKITKILAESRLSGRAGVGSARGNTATVDAGGVLKEISILLLPEVKIGDYVLLHAGFAIQKINEKEAKETLKIIREVALFEKR